MYSQPQSQPVMRGPGGIFTMARNVQDWLDARGKPVLLAYMIWSKRMFNRSYSGEGRDDNREGGRGPWATHFGSQWGGRCGHRHQGGFRSSGNSAFDAYKEETLRRLQDEQEAFQSFLQRLREAKDKTEFDAFMDDRAKQAKPSDISPKPDTTNDGPSN
jgi:hypothetical protein